MMNRIEYSSHTRVDDLIEKSLRGPVNYLIDTLVDRPETNFIWNSVTFSLNNSIAFRIYKSVENRLWREYE
jgi:hypothetical protein